MRAAIVTLAVGLAACGSASGTPFDAAVDLPLCVPQFGDSFLIDKLAILSGTTQAFDLDGDGAPDNALSPLAPFANPNFMGDIQSGVDIYLFDLQGVADVPDGGAVSLASYIGVDAHSPPTPPANLAGMGQFLVPAAAFDVSCHSRTLFDDATVVGDALTAHTRKLKLLFRAAGTIEFSDVVALGTVSLATRTIDARVGAVADACALSQASAAGPSGGSVLDQIVNLLGLQPDIDRDHDGRDQLVGDGTGIDHCVSGAGDVIPGRSCPCDPRIQDGYSVALALHAVPAEIVGLLP